MTGPGRFGPCDVCGGAAPRRFLDSERLDGPLVRCRTCGHLYVGARRGDFTFRSSDAERSRALGSRVEALGIVDVAVEEGEPAELRDLTQQERLERLRRHVPSGRLLDVGSAHGTFLLAAARYFRAEGVEPDPVTSAASRATGLTVHTTALAALEAPPGGYDVVTMHHLIEHLDSPRDGLLAAHRLLHPGGFLVIETPTVDSLLFALAPARWRQLIPDHYHFFSRATLTRLLADTGFAPVDHRKVGRRVSLRFAVDRWRRSGLPAARGLRAAIERLGVGDRSLRLVPGDIMELTARRR